MIEGHSIKALLVPVLALMLGGCDQHEEKNHLDPPKAAEIGRWKLVASGNDEKESNVHYWNAWRIDTATGQTEFCTYTVDNTNIATPHADITCSASNKPPEP